MKDDEPTPEELRQAEALARALEDRPAEPPAEALSAAALLRYSRSEGALDPTREQALLARLRRERSRPRRGLWLWLMAPLAATAAAGVIITQLGQGAFVAPRPTGTLLAAQAAAARGEGRALDDLDRHMREYRRTLFRQLGTR
jgi:hypothetical protein